MPPRLAPGFRARTLPGDLVFFLGEGDSHAVRGALFARLAGLLDGRRSVLDLIDSLDGSAGPLDVRWALGELERRGLVVEGTAREATLDAEEVEPAVAERELTRVLATRGTGHSTAGADASTNGAHGPHAVLVDDYLDPDLEQHNRRALATGAPWLPARIGPGALWLGPLLLPGEGPCWRCLATDLERCRPVAALYHRLNAGRPGPSARAVPRPLLEQAVERLARWLDGDGPDPSTRLLRLPGGDGPGEWHAVRRHPRCPACGSRDAAPAPGGLVLRPRRIRSRSGGWREHPPERVREALDPWISPLTGWVRSLARRDAGSEAILPVRLAEYPHPRPAGCWEDLTRRPRAAAAGKGADPIAAEVGALAEAIERASGVWRGDEPTRRGSLAELGDVAVDPAELLLFSAEQTRGGEGPPPLAHDAPIDWAPTLSPIDGRERWVPAALCYLDYRPGAEVSWSWSADSNGCAAGWSREEAMLQGLLELVERDAAALWWWSRAAVPALDAAAVTSLPVAELAARLEEDGRSLRLLDLTTDLGVPVVAAVARSAADESVHLGFGAHLDPRLAAARALSELAQELATRVAPLPRAGAWVEARPAIARPALRAGAASSGGAPSSGGLPRVPETGPSDDPAAPTSTVGTERRDASKAEAPSPRDGEMPDLRTAIEGLVRRLAGAGLETLVLDQTRDPAPLAVVRVLVPGLRPRWRRLAPGRLFDVPAALRWVERRLDPAELNPEPLDPDRPAGGPLRDPRRPR